MVKQSIFGRIAQLAKANINALLDQAEDPQKMLDQMVRDYKANITEAEGAVAQTIGQAQVAAFGAPRAGLTIAGFEVEHLHVHVFPAYGLENFDFGTVNNNPDPAAMDANAEKLRVALREAGHGEFVPAA